MYGYDYGYNYRSTVDSTLILLILALVLSLALAIGAMILIVPKKRRPALNGFFKFAHDLFNFRFLLIEKIIQFAYIFMTFFVIVVGVFTLFMSFGAGSEFGLVFLLSLAYIVLGPVVVRLAYEGIMLVILLVKNVIEINNKLQDQTPDQKNDSVFGANFAEYRQETPAVNYPMPEQPAQEFVFCSQCGTRYDRLQGGCPNCNK